MTLRLGSVVVNCVDIEAMTEFWSTALGLTPSSLTEGDEFRKLRGEHVNVSLQVAGSPVTARNQKHLDLYTDDKRREVERLVALGATWLRSSDVPDDDYDVLRDPEGNEFCVAVVNDFDHSASER